MMTIFFPPMMKFDDCYDVAVEWLRRLNNNQPAPFFLLRQMQADLELAGGFNAWNITIPIP